MDFDVEQSVLRRLRKKRAQSRCMAWATAQTRILAQFDRLGIRASAVRE